MCGARSATEVDRGPRMIGRDPLRVRESPAGAVGMVNLMDSLAPQQRVLRSPSMKYRGIEYTVQLVGIKRRWVVSIHLPGQELIKTRVRSHRGAESRAREMIDTWLESRAQQE